MIRRKSMRGGAVPPAWGVEMACEACHEDPLGPGTCHSHGEGKEAVDLAGDLIGSGLWVPRDQGSRGTCTAFAVVAAEELWHFRNGDGTGGTAGFQALSEEYLYSAIWRFSYEEAGVRRTAVDIRDLEADGATYLAQAKLALERFGVCSGELVPYGDDKATNFRHTQFDDAIEDEAAGRRVAPGTLVHNIVDIEQGPATGLDRIWKHARGNRRTSDVLREALAEGSPVVAAFATLDRIGRGTWFGPEAQLYGKVIYPSDRYLRGMQPDGGHTVCLIGFLPAGTEGAPKSGAFVLRNSFGELDFCWDAGRWGCGPQPACRGYGLISVDDVDRYCWEYLFRRPPGGRA